MKTFLFQEPRILWLLDCSAYLVIFFQIVTSSDLPFAVAAGLASILVTSAFSFKLAFTAEDSPELIKGFCEVLLDLFHGQSLLVRARLVFTLLGASAAYAVYSSLSGGARGASVSGMFCEFDPSSNALG